MLARRRQIRGGRGLRRPQRVSLLEFLEKLVCKRFCPIQVLGVRGHVRGVAGPLPLGERQVRRRQVQVGQRLYRGMWLQ